MGCDDLDDPYNAAVMAAFEYEHEVDGDGGIGPAHLLVGIAAGDTETARAIAAGGRLREVVTSDALLRPAVSWLQAQAQRTAALLADRFEQDRGPEHLLIALLDQGTPEVVEALCRVGSDPANVRRAALARLALPVDLLCVPLDTPDPAGTNDRPALPIEELDDRAWRVLCWRAEHLPLSRFHRHSDLRALRSLERAAAWRVADRYHLDDDQRYSLYAQHSAQVERIASAAMPNLVETRAQLMERHRPVGRPRYGRLHERWIRAVPNFIAGWPSWLGNRRVGMRNQWFWLRTRRAYRGQPG